MELPFISVVVPIYNRKGWIQELLPTLQAQTYPQDRYEIIMVDNGSKDGAWEWVNELAAASPITLRCFRNDDPVKVPAASRNRGIREARGEFVAFTDSDCQVTPGWLKGLAAAFDDGVGVVEGRTIPVPTDPAPPLCRIKVVDGSRSLFDTCNIMYRRSALLEVGGFARDFYENGYPRYYGEDLDLGYRVKSRGYKVAFASDAVVMHHNQPQTLWQWLKEPRLVFICPYIALKHPTARAELLFAKYFLSPSTAAFDVALLATVLAFAVHPAFVLGWAPYGIAKLREQGTGGGLVSRGVRLAGGVVRSFVTFAVLAAASARYRSLIL
jgi:GT2 family glycosyltransferase